MLNVDEARHITISGRETFMDTFEEKHPEFVAFLETEILDEALSGCGRAIIWIGSPRYNNIERKNVVLYLKFKGFIIDDRAIMAEVEYKPNINNLDSTLQPKDTLAVSWFA